MDFGEALKIIKTGGHVAREGWNGKGMWLELFVSWNGSAAGDKSMPEDWRGHKPFIAIYTADKFLIPWLASQADLLTEDWVEVV